MTWAAATESRLQEAVAVCQISSWSIIFGDSPRQPQVVNPTHHHGGNVKAGDDLEHTGDAHPAAQSGGPPASHPSNSDRTAGGGGDRLDALISLLVAEYDVLRGEIGRYQDHQKDVMNFVFLVLGGLLAFTGTLLGIGKPDVLTRGSLIALFLPPVFALLAGLYSDRTIRILRLADYISNHLRKRVSRAVGTRVWQWEIYKRHGSPFHPGLAYTLDKVRWLVFIFPMMASTGLYFVVSGWHGDGWAYFGLATLAVSLIGAFAVMFVAEETRGVANRDGTDLDGFDADIM